MSYDYMDLVFSTGGLQGYISAGVDTPVGSGTLLDRHTLSKSELVFASDPLTIRIEPYQLSCELVLGDGDFVVNSLVSEDTTCYTIDPTICKLLQRVCP